MGFGMASVFATGFLWLENHTPVTSRIGALLSIFASLGPDVFPVVVGQFIDREPMVMVYVTLAAVAVCAGANNLSQLQRSLDFFETWKAHGHLRAAELARYLERRHTDGPRADALELAGINALLGESHRGLGAARAFRIGL